MSLLIICIKPNPAGPDWHASHAERVAMMPPRLHSPGDPGRRSSSGEWVDFRNDAGQSVALDGVALYHLAYDAHGQSSWAHITGFSGSLPAGKIVRVHAGRKRDVSVIRPEDRAGADYHIFTGEDVYVWNNDKGDSPLLQDETKRETIDKTWYAPHPPEGLVRQGDQLVAHARAVNW